MKQEEEPVAIGELQRIRQEILAEEANRQAREFARRHGLKYVEAKPGVETVREKPSKRYKAR
jgi:hypothetical protein